VATLKAFRFLSLSDPAWPVIDAGGLLALREPSSEGQSKPIVFALPRILSEEAEKLHQIFPVAFITLCIPGNQARCSCKPRTELLI
jgi:hypothetical protein